jgi:hypothetical protein
MGKGERNMNGENRGGKEVLHTSLLNIAVVTFKILPLRSYPPMPARNPHLKTILEMILWNGLQSCRRITPDVISVVTYLPFNISFIFGNRKKVTGG